MNLDEFRQQNPAYSDKSSWPDDKLATGLYNKYYSKKMSMEDFTKSVGMAPVTTAPEKKTKPDMSAEQWQNYADKNEETSKTDDEQGLVEPWVNPVDAVTGPLGMPARALVGKLIGKGVSESMASWGLKKTATAIATSLAAEPAVGTIMEQADDAMTEADMPLAVKLPVNLVTGMVTGTLAEGGIRQLSSSVRKALLAKGADATPESVFKALKSFKVEDADVSGSEEVISDLTKHNPRPANMKDTVVAITKAKKDKGIDIPEIKIEDIVKGETGEHLHGAVLGAGAGLSQDDEGNYSLDPKLMLAGAVAGGLAATQINKIIGGTRKPGIKGGVKHEIKQLRTAAKELKEAGHDAKSIFQKVGLWQADDGRWRHEIDDSQAKIMMPVTDSQLKGKKVGDIVEHPELFKHYPQLRDIPLDTLSGRGNLGCFQDGTDALTDVGKISINLDNPSSDKTLLHELQHAVQFIEGHENGGNSNWVMSIDQNMRAKIVTMKEVLKTTPADSKSIQRKMIKKVERERQRFGMKEDGDYIDQTKVEIAENSRARTQITGDIHQLEFAGKKGTPEYDKLVDQRRKLSGEGIDLVDKLDNAMDLYSNTAFMRYEDILGEQEARWTAERMTMSADMRAKTMPEFEDTLVLSKFVARSGISATTATLGGAYTGVDWDEFEETGNIVIDPEKMLKGALLGAAAGMGITSAPKLASKWTAATKEKVIGPLKDLVNGSITNESVRYQLGLSRSAEVQDMVRSYKTKADLVLRKAVDLGQELNDVAPTSLAQRRLGQILEGGITTNPSLAKKAHKINAMFKGLKEATRDLNLSHYSKFDELTKKQRAELRSIIKDPDVELAETTTAQEMLNNYYHTGSAKEYLPIFNPQVEGLTKADKKILTSEIAGLKKQSRYMNPEGNPVLEDQIAQLEIMLKQGSKEKTRAKGVTLDQGYAHMRQDLPAETVATFNRIIGTSYRVAKGAATQATDVLKMQVLKEVESNPEWVLPKRIKGEAAQAIPANYVKLTGKEWGPLDGKRIRNDVLADLETVIDRRNDFERGMDKYLGYWKYGKAILNPVTHARNAVSNAVLAYFAGVNPADTHTYASAAKAIKEGRANQHFKEAEGWGLYNNTFIESDVSAIRDELDELRGASKLATWIRKAVALPSVAYDQSERFFKTAVFINQRESGKTIDEAARHAEEYLFNYQDIPPVVKHYKRWAAPFATYTYKAVPKMAETMITQPWKVGAVFGGMYGLTEMAKGKLGVTDEEVAIDRDQLMQKSGVSQVLLPFRDEYDNKLYFDADSFMPWSGIGQTWGQSSIGLGDWLPSHPVFTIAAAVMSNKEAFTGHEIYDTILDSNAQIMGKYLDYAWKQLGPSLAPGGYGFSKLLAGFKNDVLGGEVEDYMGRKKNIGDAVISAMMGIKLTPANQGKVDQFASMHLKQIRRSVNSKKAEIKKKLNRKEITMDEATRQMQALMYLQKTAVDYGLGKVLD